jgi:hypothetical protein
MFVMHKLYQTAHHLKFNNISTTFLIKTKKQPLFIVIWWISIDPISAIAGN